MAYKSTPFLVSLLLPERHTTQSGTVEAESGKPTQITCPGQQSVAVQQSSQKKGFVAHFEAEVCQTCPFLQKCPAQRGKRDLRFHLRFNQQQVNMSQRRQRSLAHQEEGRNLRAAVEATVRQVKHPFPASKLPVRGRFRVSFFGSLKTIWEGRIMPFSLQKLCLGC
jgi:hypothetical protein